MKKAILLLAILMSGLIYSQNPTGTTSAGKFKAYTSTKDNTATRVVVQDSITKEYRWILKSSLAGSGGNQDLESVLTEGNISEVDITITDALGENYVNYTQNGIFLESTTDTKGIALTKDGIDINTNGGNNSRIKSDDLTANRTHQLPDDSGILNLSSIVTSNKTASNGVVYNANGTIVFTDPTPVTNKGYIVHVIGGTSTIGGVGYTTGALVYRYHNGSSWVSKDYGSGSSGTVTTVTGTAPIVITSTPTTTPNVTITDAAADNTTKGASSFSSSDFNSSVGNISIDYTNGQAADTSTKGFLTSTDWNTFNGKQAALVSGTNIKTIESNSLLGSGNIDLSKTDVGLSNVDNTSDVNKPVSTAQQTALDLKSTIPTGWTAYGGTSTVVGCSSYTYKLINYIQNGKEAVVQWDIEGVSDSTQLTFTIPFTTTAIRQSALCAGLNNVSYGSCMAFIDAATSTIKIVFNSANYTATNTWTSGVTKRCFGQMTISSQ